MEGADALCDDRRVGQWHTHANIRFSDQPSEVIDITHQDRCLGMHGLEEDGREPLEPARDEDSMGLLEQPSLLTITHASEGMDGGWVLASSDPVMQPSLEPPRTGDGEVRIEIGPLDTEIPSVEEEVRGPSARSTVRGTRTAAAPLRARPNHRDARM